MDKMYLWSTLQNAHADYSRFRMLDHIAIPVTAFFVATDLMTVHLYTESLFDERPEMAMLVAASIALLLDACPMVAGKLKGQLDDMLPRDQRATKRRISALLGTAVGAFAIFAGFCIVSTLISVEALGATENPTLYMVGQYIRMLLPIATSVGSYAIGFFSDHRSQLTCRTWLPTPTAPSAMRSLQQQTLTRTSRTTALRRQSSRA